MSLLLGSKMLKPILAQGHCMDQGDSWEGPLALDVYQSPRGHPGEVRRDCQGGSQEGRQHILLWRSIQGLDVDEGMDDGVDEADA